ncbi:hypothetical protein ACLMJK_000128 [Lecanora helva]
MVHVEGFQPPNEVPFRRQLKDEAKKKRRNERAGDPNASKTNYQGSTDLLTPNRWRLTVGLEIHAQLNTECKLFSEARCDNEGSPNSNVSLFDLAFPGSQPDFQQATLIPALRAALGLSCDVQQRSRFDCKHYYYQDQPAGYQITQYYEPFAVNGFLTLHDHDGIAAADGESITVGIKQIQMEQDTAKSTLQPPSTSLLDFNRVGYPLIEIITLPDIHHPRTASACARKIQAILQAVNANTTGMELGGLRVDVNVSVAPRNSDSLGQRTEIKNLSSFKAIEDAIIAEQNRQISVLESGGTVYGETRGWTIGSTETTRLRGKEGEVDYRYMPDPDVPPLLINSVSSECMKSQTMSLTLSAKDLISKVSSNLPQLPEDAVAELVDQHVTLKDAKTLVSLDDGERLDYFDEVVMLCETELAKLNVQPKALNRTVANWVLHELGGLLNSSNLAFSPNLVPAKSLADIIISLERDRVTGSTAKRLITMVYEGDERSIDTMIMEDNLEFQALPQADYLTMAQSLINENQTKVKQIQEKKQLGKLHFFVGQMMRQGEGKIEASKAEAVLKELLGLD